jgi:hypothetical protein
MQDVINRFSLPSFNCVLDVPFLFRTACLAKIPAFLLSQGTLLVDVKFKAR